MANQSSHSLLAYSYEGGEADYNNSENGNQCLKELDGAVNEVTPNPIDEQEGSSIPDGLNDTNLVLRDFEV